MLKQVSIGRLADWYVARNIVHIKFISNRMAQKNDKAYIYLIIYN